MGAAIGAGEQHRRSHTAPTSSTVPRRRSHQGQVALWKRLTPAQGHSSTPHRWQKEILLGFLFVFLSFFFRFLFVFWVFCFLKEKYSEDTKKRIQKREKGKRC